MKLSIVFSTYNELKLPFFEQSLRLYQTYKNIEVICVDMNSTDGTIELAKDLGAKVISTTENSRAKRQNIGVHEASSKYILLHHPRSSIDKDGIDFLLKNQDKYIWGAFTHRFDARSPIYKFTSWYSNQVRAKLRNIAYLDHCIFFTKEIFYKVDGVPEIDIFEDTAFSEKLNTVSHCELLPYYSTTSAIRFKKNGVFRQSILNQVLKLAYLLKLDHKTMNKIYEVGLELNSKY